VRQIRIFVAFFRKGPVLWRMCTMVQKRTICAFGFPACFRAQCRRVRWQPRGARDDRTGLERRHM